MKLAAYLESQNITPEQFSDRVGVHKTTVYRWLRGARRPTDEGTLSRIYVETKGAVTANDFFSVNEASDRRECAAA